MFLFGGVIPFTWYLIRKANRLKKIKTRAKEFSEAAETVEPILMQ